MLVDPTGKRPTDREAYLMAEASYLDVGDLNNDNELIIKLHESGWNISSLGSELTLNNETSGLNSLVFEKTVDGVTEYAYVFRGTKELVDAHCDEFAQTSSRSS